ncbi:hypothetical protein PENSPDRAFT_659428 [Peniophora sp. CONT]|nr:hypothetical protein PENSPDRAFT_659428 [Peniophora sp. CONT]
MHDIDIVHAFFLSAWVVGPLYVLSFILFIICVRSLLGRRFSGSSWVLLATTTAQMLLCTGHIITTIVQIFQAISVDAHGTGVIDNTYISNQSAPAHVAQVVLYITNSLIADGVLIWRCYVVWNKRLYIWTPLVLLLAGNGITGYIAMAHLSRLTPQSAIFDKSVGLYIQATWSLSIATQVIASLLIAGKVFITGARLGSGSEGLRFGGYHATILWTVIESGALYSFTTVLLLVFYVKGAQAGAVCAAILGQLSATAPYLILARVEHNRQRIFKQTPPAVPPSHASAQSSKQAQSENIPLELIARIHRRSSSAKPKNIDLRGEDVDVLDIKNTVV